MKKIIICILVFSMLFLSACFDKNNSQSSNNEITSNTSSNDIINPITPPILVDNYHADNFRDFKKCFYVGWDYRMDDYNRNGSWKDYSDFINKTISDNYIYVPCFDDYDMSNVDNFDNVTCEIDLGGFSFSANVETMPATYFKYYFEDSAAYITFYYNNKQYSLKEFVSAYSFSESVLGYGLFLYDSETIYGIDDIISKYGDNPLEWFTDEVITDKSAPLGFQYEYETTNPYGYKDKNEKIGMYLIKNLEDYNLNLQLKDRVVEAYALGSPKKHNTYFHSVNPEINRMNILFEYDDLIVSVSFYDEFNISNKSLCGFGIDADNCGFDGSCIELLNNFSIEKLIIN